MKLAENILVNLRLFVVLSTLICALAIGPASAACWVEAASTHRVDPILLKAIAWNESRGRPNAIGPALPDNNRALGVMQINTIHLRVLQQHGISRQALFEPCTNIRVGAWVLADCIGRFGEVWRAVGCYYAGPHSRAFAAMERYVSAVRKNYEGYLHDENAKVDPRAVFNE
jgi:soluble lytic murein transglycosylase-like protein